MKLSLDVVAIKEEAMVRKKQGESLQVDTTSPTASTRTPCSSFSALSEVPEAMEASPLHSQAMEASLLHHDDFVRNISDQDYAEPTQTMLIFDWDDTLFPTTELFKRWGCDIREAAAGVKALDGEQLKALRRWEDALLQHLKLAGAMSERCVIVTNSRRPWVSDCIDHFAPRLRELFECEARAPMVIYAGEQLRPTQTHLGQCRDLRPVFMRNQSVVTREEFREEMTLAKYKAMKNAAADFYSRYPGQTWKNIVSFGDMVYEHDALQEVSFRRMVESPGRECLRAKSVLLPSEPKMLELTVRLQLCTVLLPAIVCHNGDIAADLQNSSDPMKTLADALSMPVLDKVPPCPQAWGQAGDDRIPEGSLSDVLADIAFGIQEWIER